MATHESRDRQFDNDNETPRAQDVSSRLLLWSICIIAVGTFFHMAEHWAPAALE